MGEGETAQDGTSQFLALGAGFFALGYILGRQRAVGGNHSAAADCGAAASKRRGIKDGKKEPLYIDRLAELHSEFKMVLIVRSDLKMSKGKVASQCSHATVGLYKKICNRAPKALQRDKGCPLKILIRRNRGLFAKQKFIVGISALGMFRMILHKSSREPTWCHLSVPLSVSLSCLFLSLLPLVLLLACNMTESSHCFQNCNRNLVCRLVFSIAYTHCRELMKSVEKL